MTTFCRKTMVTVVAAVAAMVSFTSISHTTVHANAYTDAGWHYAADMDGAFLTSAQKQEVTRAAADILAALPLTGDQRSDVAVIYQYVRDHVSYDYSRPVQDLAATAYNAIHGSAVCEGYASLFLNLCTQAGIDCRLYASSTANHVWNVVYLDGQPYICDVTWDSCVNQNKAKNDYFLIAPAAYQPMQNADAHDATALCQISDPETYYANDLADGKYVLNEHHVCAYLFTQSGQWQAADSCVTFRKTGAAITPGEFVYYGKNQLVRNQDYTVSYQNNAAAGTGIIVLHGMGKYTGIVTYSFRITE